ncbi:hypothetical protein [Enterovibrio calviensis]|uniref:hypothetical protein n=1 Tax=Enterovibrio calviensis TaxID=91359 RepID=UPI00048A1497|nr:hypothetical protein [Enterovibrio calviensis]
MNEQDIYVNDPMPQDERDFVSMWAEESKADAGKQGQSLTFNDDADFPVEYEEETNQDDYDKDILERADVAQDEMLEEQAEAMENFSRSFDELPENLTLSIGGKELSKKQVQSIVQRSEELDGAYSHMVNLGRDLEANEQFLKERLVGVQTEADRQISVVQRKLADPYLTDADRGRLYQQLNNAQARKNVIEGEVNQYSRMVEANRAKEIESRYHLVDSRLSRSHSDWSEIKEDVGQYIVKSGMNLQDVARVLTPEFAEIAIKAMKYDRSIKKAVDTLKKPVVRQRATPTPAKRTTTPRQTDAVEAFKRGHAGDYEMSDVFDFLED